MNDFKELFIDIYRMMFGSSTSKITSGLTAMADKLEAHAEKQRLMSRKHITRSNILIDASLEASADAFKATSTASNIRNLIA